MYIVVYILYTCIIVVVVLLYFRKYENNMKVFSYEIKFKSYVRIIKVCTKVL